MGRKAKIKRKTCVVCGRTRKKEFLQRTGRKWACSECLPPVPEENSSNAVKEQPPTVIDTIHSCWYCHATMNQMPGYMKCSACGGIRRI